MPPRAVVAAALRTVVAAALSAVVAAAATLVAPTPASPTPTHVPELDATKGRTTVQETAYAELDGWKVAFDAAGAGSPSVVFVHGATSSRKVWRDQMRGLDLGRRLLAVDLLGHGDSGRPETDYTMELLARSVAAAMDADGVDRAVLVGHSLGVAVVRQFHRLYPERTEALVAVDGGLRATLSGQVASWMRTTLERPDFEEVHREMVRQMPTGSLPEEDVELLRSDALATPRHVMLGTLDAQLDPAVWEEDPVDVPLLVVLSPQPHWTPEYEEFVRGLAPHVEYVLWEDVSHFLMLEEPERFNELLADFVTRTSR